MKGSRATQPSHTGAMPPSGGGYGVHTAKFDHEERIVIRGARSDGTSGQRKDGSCPVREHRVTFTTHIFPDPVDPNWVPYIRQCRERFAYRLFNTLIASSTSPYVINKNLKIIGTLPCVTHWEQFAVWNDVDRKVQTLRIARKREISNKFRTQNVVNEKNLMFCCEFPFILDFDFHFQTTSLLCMVVELPGRSLQVRTKLKCFEARHFARFQQFSGPFCEEGIACMQKWSTRSHRCPLGQF